ncbi:unnamed protein product [Leptidea sinapis]|uniref:Uncharacterized protein n=1 Tax=Leptidea sinapis TaxID=189913 RepID=A0A5E4QG33_9NEOP|nr:unnamed protein product [Leptidea sinapis]
MSDRIEKLYREYDKNVHPDDYPRSVGLFTIPEYPELEAEEGMWSTVLDVVITSLRYLAPATILTIFWGQQSFFFKILKYIDSTFRALIFSSEEQKQAVIQWLSEAGNVRVGDLDTVWRHGWILCGLLDGALPGACAGHPPIKLTLEHAQDIADHYLGVQPMFTKQELESNDVLSKHQEWKLTNYLDKIRLAMAKLTPPTVPKPVSTNTTTAAANLTYEYVARGSGLTAAHIKHKTYFKIYPTAQQSLDPGEVEIFIKGPKNIFGTATVSPILGKAQLIRQTLLGLQSKSNNYTENVLPITQGTAYLRSYGKNDMKKTYYIPKTKYDIEIETERHSDHVRIGYIVPIEGKYEVTITSRGQNIVGSPFNVTASTNIIKTLERDSFSLEDGEEIDIVDIKSDRKAILRIVDFVTEKMLLKENGSLETITDDDAKKLLESNTTFVDSSPNEDKIKINCDFVTQNISNADKTEAKKFYDIARKILTMNRVCNIIRKDIKNEDIEMINTKENPKAIPDVVNSTIYDHNPIYYTNRDKIIIPENISVSLFTERPKTKESHADNLKNINYENVSKCNENVYIPDDDDTISIDTQSTNNPFTLDVYESSYKIEKSFGSFITNEYETNNSQNEVSQSFRNPLTVSESTEIRLLYETSKNSNVHFDGFDKINIDSQSNNIKHTRATNPFISVLENESYKEKERLTDFIIGAPVSLPPLVGLNQSEKDILSLSFEKSRNIKSLHDLYCVREKDASSFLSTQDSFDHKEDFLAVSPFHSLGSDTYNFLSQGNLQRSRDMSPKELWDSAYVSIDENSSNPDNNNNSSNRSVSETSLRNISSFINDDNSSESIEEYDDFTTVDESRCNKLEFKRQVFTPIIEENEKIVSSSMKDTIDQKELEEVSKAFGELNEIYDDIFSNNDDSSSSISVNTIPHKSEMDYITENNKISVDSASEVKTDMKRHKRQNEGAISEVQIIDTESVSASQYLHAEENEMSEIRKSKENTQFGDQVQSNIVLEKKKYWDEKIRQIEAKRLEESKVQLKRRRSYSKHLKYNDSLNKRKGKQMVKNFLTLENERDEKIEKQPCLGNDVKRVENWTSLWDTHFEIQDQDKSCQNHIKDSKHADRTTVSTPVNIDIVDIETDTTPRNELSEEVFKAFETCPKRFFGTSRKHIISKIENFLGKSYSENKPISEPQQFNNGSGLVSSRISLFHKYSNSTELTSTKNNKTQNKILTKNYIENNIKRDVCDRRQKQDKEDLENCGTEPEIQVNIDNKNDFSRQSECFEKSSMSNENAMILLENSNEIVLRLQENTNTEMEEKTRGKEWIDDSNKLNKCTEPIIYNLKQTNDNNSFSKSELDIFSRTSDTNDDEKFHKYKSVEELPKINVKNFILLYEDVSRVTKPLRNTTNRKFTYSSSSIPGTPSKSQQTTCFNSNSLPVSGQYNLTMNESLLNLPTRCCSVDSALVHEEDKKYSSLSDIELEIIEKKSENGEGMRSTSTKPDDINQDGYKDRFKMAKQYFQSLEELRDVRKIKECKIVVNTSSTESLEGTEASNSKRAKGKKAKLKSHSMPSSEISRIWQEMQQNHAEGPDSKKLMKISEKFNVDDLFEDVMEGRLSRQGSLRGIPHKKAVLEAFKSMENINSNNKLNSYEMTMSQLTDFAKEYKVKNAQTYLSEYPYLPTTDPSKYQSRLDANASGLISYTELLKTKPRRNSVPDLRINTTFTESL